MDEINQARNEARRAIADRNRRYANESRLHKLTMAITGLMVYSTFGNFLGALLTFGKAPIDAGVAIFFGALYAIGVYRVWSKDDIRWWPVAVPAGFSIAWILLAWWATGRLLPIPLILNLVLLALVPFRRKATAVLAAAPNNSFKPTSESLRASDAA